MAFPLRAGTGGCPVVTLLIAVPAKTHQMVQERHGASEGALLDRICVLSVVLLSNRLLMLQLAVFYATVRCEYTVRCHQINSSAEL